MEAAMSYKKWLCTANGGWSLFTVGALLLFTGVFLAIIGTPMALYILGPIGLALAAAGGFVAVLFHDTPHHKN
jgi:hypothetical protein